MVFKWIGVFLGSLAAGPIGALLGYLVGAAVDGFVSSDTENVSIPDEDAPPLHTEQEGRRNSFLYVLLAGMAYVIRADGKVMHSEMECVRAFLRQNFGEEAAAEGDAIIRRFFERDKADPQGFRNIVLACCGQLRSAMNDTQRLSLLNFYVQLAKADGSVPEAELAVLRELAYALGLSATHVDRLLGLGSDTLEDAYKVLGVPATATEAELKKAYRQLVVENHPDRVASLGDDVRRAAEKKMQQINAAKEKIWKARGIA